MLKMDFIGQISVAISFLAIVLLSFCRIKPNIFIRNENYLNAIRTMGLYNN